MKSAIYKNEIKRLEILENDCLNNKRTAIFFNKAEASMASDGWKKGEIGYFNHIDFLVTGQKQGWLSID